MSGFLNHFLAMALFFAGSTSVSAGGIDVADATLGCMLDPSKSIYLFPEEKTVLLSAAGRESVALKIEKFEVYRCPGCFGFLGTGDGHSYEGETEGHLDEGTGQWNVFLDLRLDGGEPKRSTCFWRQ